MTQKKNILIHDFGLPTKKKYLSPSIRLCKALSLECVMNEGPASAGGYGGTMKPENPEEFEEQFSKQRYTPDFYSGYDE